MPPERRESFKADLRFAKEAQCRSVVESTRVHENAAWAHWETFCQAHNIDCFLIGVQGAESCLQVFLARVRKGALNSSNRQVLAGTVAKYLTAISKRIVSLVEKADRDPAIDRGSYSPGLTNMLKGFARDDPPPNRVWPVNVRILKELRRMLPMEGFSPDKWRRVQDMCTIGFFFMLRPGEYAQTSTRDTQTKPLRVDNVYFLQNKSTAALPPTALSCNDSSLYFGGITLDDQKAGHKGDRVTHSATNKELCPVVSLRRVVSDILAHHGSYNTPLFSYHESHPSKGEPRFLDLSSDDLTKALRHAAAACFKETGIPPDKISARSLRAGGATALLCAGVTSDIVKLLGHWRSDSVDIYTRTSTHTLTEHYATKMFDAGEYKFSSYQANEDWPELPDLLPDDAPADIQDAYFGSLVNSTASDPTAA